MLNTEKRRLQRSTSSSNNLDIDTGILGEYKPPPDVDFDALIQDSFDKHGDLLLDKLSQKQYFQKINEIKSYSSFASEATPQVKIKSSPTQDTPQKENGAATSTTAIIVYAICGPLLLVSIIVICCVLQRYGKDDVIVFDEDPNFLSKLSYAQPEQGSGGTIASNSMYASRRNSFNIDDCSYGVHSRGSRPYY